MARRILVVDDDHALARALRRDLEAALSGSVVDAVFDGGSAIALMKQRSYDACVVDWVMSPIGGADVVQAAAEQTCAAFVLSAHMDVRTTVKAMSGGAQDVLEKPLHLPSLLTALKKLEPKAAATHDGALHDEPETLLLGTSAAMCRARDLLERFASFHDVPVLVTGETGSGKGVAARQLHSLARPGRPFVVVNCAAIPENLLESELFGHEAGSFTNAHKRRQGLLETAGDGVLFLDEIGEMSGPLQAKLLNVLEEGAYRRVGSNQELKLRARIVAATNRTVWGPDSSLREDLYFRLAGCILDFPPLRERLEDIDVLAPSLLHAFCSKHVNRSIELTAEALDVLKEYHWPGNVRELRRVVESAAIFCDGRVIAGADMGVALKARFSVARCHPATSGEWPVDSERTPGSKPLWIPPRPPADSGPDLGEMPLREAERMRIVRAFDENGQNVSLTARRLGIPRSTLRDKLRRYGVG